MPDVLVHIPPVLRFSAGGERKVSAKGTTVEEALLDLAGRFPALHPQFFTTPEPDDEKKYHLNRYVHVYVDGEDIKVLGGLATVVADGTELVILPAMAGGALALELADEIS
jgi:molybdopterin converting factor small subunit